MIAINMYNREWCPNTVLSPYNSHLLITSSKQISNYSQNRLSSYYMTHCSKSNYNLAITYVVIFSYKCVDNLFQFSIWNSAVSSFDRYCQL
jgi:hypothetical protein